MRISSESFSPIKISLQSFGGLQPGNIDVVAGLEQGFTLESAPGEPRDGDRLRVVLALEGDLRAQAVDSGQALEFKDGAGQPVLRYDHLVVRDAGGRELEARMAVRTGEVWLEVDDRGALWPVTIDPTCRGLADRYNNTFSERLARGMSRSELCRMGLEGR